MVRSDYMLADSVPRYRNGVRVRVGDRALLPTGQVCRVRRVGQAVVIVDTRSGTKYQAWHAPRLRFVARLVWSAADAV